MKSFGFNLIPGENDVPVENWKQYQSVKKEECEGRIRRHEIRVHPDRSKATPWIDKITEFNEEQAVAVVEGSNNTHHLEKWAKLDGRGKVQDAIGRRLAILKAPSGPPIEKRKNT